MREVPLSEIELERKLAQWAMMAGAPTIIPYDVVRCGKGGYYGIVFEKMNAKTLAETIKEEPYKVDEYAAKLGSCVHALHEIKVDDDELPHIRDRYRNWITESMTLDDNAKKNLLSVVESVKSRNNYVHGDIRLENVLVYNDELFLVDMASSGQGDPIFDLQWLYASLIGTEKEEEFFASVSYGLSSKTCERIWNVFLDAYLGEEATNKREDIEKMVKGCYAFTRKVMASLSAAIR